MLERIVRVDSGSLATRAWLRRSGPCVVLVHGHATNLESWGSLIPRLRDWCSIIAFDRRGHGHSSDARSFTAMELANDIAAVTIAYDVAEPIIIGHSAGAWDALAYAAQAAPLGVICLDQAIASDDPIWRESLQQNNDRTTSAQEDPGHTDAEWAIRMAQGEAELGQQLWRETYGPMNRRGAVRGPDGLIRYRPGPQARKRIQADWTTFAACAPHDDIACPIVVVLAQHNQGPIHDALRRHAAARQFETVEAESGHDIHVEQPHLIADIVHRIAELGPPR